MDFDDGEGVSNVRCVEEILLRHRILEGPTVIIPVVQNEMSVPEFQAVRNSGAVGRISAFDFIGQNSGSDHKFCSLTK